MISLITETRRLTGAVLGARNQVLERVKEESGGDISLVKLFPIIQHFPFKQIKYLERNIPF